MDWILLLDDEPLASRALERLIRLRLRIDVVTREDIASALEVLRGSQAPPAAMVLDGRLGPNESGAGFLSAARAAGTTSRCAFWTGSDIARLSRELAAAGIEEPVPVFDKLDVYALLAWLVGP